MNITNDRELVVILVQNSESNYITVQNQQQY